jgi:hypothetical protein
MMKRFVLLSVALLMFTSAVPVRADDVTFSYQFEPGASSRYKVSFTSETDLGSGAMRVLADLKVTILCESAADGKYSMKMTFDEVDMSREVFGNLQPDPGAEAMVGKTIAYSVDGNGKVEDITPAPFFDGWEQSQQFFEPLINGWYEYLPGIAVPVGQGWKKQLEQPGMGGLSVVASVDATFKEMKKEKGRECARVVGETRQDISGQSESAMGTFKVAGKGEGKFELYFDPVARTVVKRKSAMQVESDVAPVAGGDNAITTNVSYHAEIELL